MGRIGNVFRVHFADKRATFMAPLLIVGIAAAVIVMIGVVGMLMGAERNSLWEGMQYSGAIWAFLGMGIGIGFATMGQYLSFALGMGITRREWVTGSALMFLLLTVIITIVVVVGKLIEVATGGWGMGVRLFDTVHTNTGPWWQTAIQTFVIVFASMFFCAMLGAVWNRWGKAGLYWIGGVLLFLLLVGFGLSLIFPWEQVVSVLTAIVSIGWAAWMAVLAGVGVASGAIWAVLARRVEVR